MNLLSDVLTYMRRILKSYTNGEIDDNLLIDYVNRFYINDVDARVQLWDLRKSYEFTTYPGVDKYNMPLYSTSAVSPSNGFSYNMYPVYQGFFDPCYIDGYETTFFISLTQFYRIFGEYDQKLQVLATGDGVETNFDLTFPIIGQSNVALNPPIQAILRGHVDIAGIIATGNNIDPPLGLTIDQNIPVTSINSQVWITTIDNNNAPMVVVDSGQMLSNAPNYGLLMNPGKAPYGNQPLNGNYSITENTINYLEGTANVTFPSPPGAGANISARVKYFQCGRPRGILFHNNTLTLRQPPDRQYVVQLQGYMTPAAFLSSSEALPYGYMAEYLSRGAARKILSDTGDVEQFQFYEPLFREQEKLVLARSDRQKTATRVQTIYSSGASIFGQNNFYNGGNTL